MDGILIFLTDGRNLLSMGVGVLVFATVLTLLSGVVGKADLDKRMKAVAERPSRRRADCARPTRASRSGSSTS